jgi:outer membrane protein OmpA-like peptidoglycan-associated protein
MYISESQLPTSNYGLVDDYAGSNGHFHGLGEDCGTACLALRSMERSAEGICRLAGTFSLPCIKAKARVVAARARVLVAGCNCQEAVPPNVSASMPPDSVSGFGQFPWQRPRPSLAQGGPQLQMPPFETITGFPQDRTSLNAVQLTSLNRTAEFITRSWTGNTPITSVRVTGYINANEWQSDLGERRATAVRDALVSAIGRIQPGLPTRIRWITEDRGLSSFAKVDIFLWVGPTQSPVPPLIRIPSPAEAARRLVPLGPETPEQRIQRILRELPPAPLPRRSFSQMFWQRVDEQLNSVMNRLNVPTSLRGHLRDGVYAAISRGSEALLNEIVGATRLPGEAQEAIRTTTRALLDVPIR